MNNLSIAQYEEKIKTLESEKEQAYWERNQLVAFLSKQYPSHLTKHDINDTTWDRDWLNIVCIHVVKGITKTPGLKQVNDTKFVKDETLHELQFTWHIHDNDLKYFHHLKFKKSHYDGHTTEQKYQNLAAL